MVKRVSKAASGRQEFEGVVRPNPILFVVLLLLFPLESTLERGLAALPSAEGILRTVAGILFVAGLVVWMVRGEGRLRVVFDPVERIVSWRHDRTRRPSEGRISFDDIRSLQPARNPGGPPSRLVVLDTRDGAVLLMELRNDFAHREVVEELQAIVATRAAAIG